MNSRCHALPRGTVEAVRRRRGYSMMIVLGLLSVGMSLSYAALHSQATNVRLARNVQLSDSAHEAALTGLSVALRRLNQSSWAGVDQAITGTLSASSGYAVTFETGDDRLLPSDPDYSLWPYRLTLTSQGYAQDPRLTQAIALRTVRAVVQLVPRQLASAPADWRRFQDFTVFQHRDRDFSLHVPSRIAGPVWIQGVLKIAHDYPRDNDARNTYLQDLNQMRQAGWPDYRPLGGSPVHLHYGSQSSATANHLNLLGISTSSALNMVGAWQAATETSHYRLYPGGKLYSIPQLPQSLNNTMLEPDPQTNPLGLFYRGGSTLYLENNVQVRGTLLAHDIHITGRNVQLVGHNLPPVLGESVPVQLPVIVARNDVKTHENAAVNITGAVSVSNRFEVRRANATSTVNVVGRVVAGELLLGGRSDWDMAASTWHLYLLLFQWQSGVNVIPYFPVYMGLFGFPPQPPVTISPPQTDVVFHWQGSNTPIYLEKSDDGGLRWEVLCWGVAAD